MNTHYHRRPPLVAPLIIIACMLSVIVLMATLANAGPLQHWGVKGGYVGAKQVWEGGAIGNDMLSRRNGYQFGFFAELFDVRGISLSTGVVYELKGTAVTVTVISVIGEDLGEQTLNSQLNYLSIPLLAKFVGDGANVLPYITAGPRIDIFLGHAEGGRNLTFGIEDEFSDVTLGISLGGGLQGMVNGNVLVFVEFLFNYDPFWLHEFPNSLVGAEQRVKNESFNISIGVGL